MKNFLKYIVVIVLMCFDFLSAQGKGDFNLMLSNGIEKMYQDPDLGIKAIKSINYTDSDTRQQLIIRSLLTDAYFLKADYDEASKMTLENVNAKENLSKNDQLLVNVGMIQLLQNLNLYDQSENLLKSTSENFEKYLKTDENKLVAAKLFYLEAKNFFNKNNINDAKYSILNSKKLCDGNDVYGINLLASNILLESKIAFQKQDGTETNQHLKELKDIVLEVPKNVFLQSQIAQLKAEILFNQNKHQDAVTEMDSAILKINHVDFLGQKNAIYGDLAKNYLALRNNEQY